MAASGGDGGGRGACTQEAEPLSRPVLPPPGDALTLFITIYYVLAK